MSPNHGLVAVVKVGRAYGIPCLGKGAIGRRNTLIVAVPRLGSLAGRACYHRPQLDDILGKIAPARCLQDTDTGSKLHFSRGRTTGGTAEHRCVTALEK